MKTAKKLIPTCTQIFQCEIETCLTCGKPLVNRFLSDRQEDGLAPEGGEAQLWTVRELRTGLTVRCGWMSGQEQVSFENFLTPIVASGFRVTEILSDKQRGLLPAIKAVFPDAKHALCQAHYLKNIAEPIAEKDEAMKLELRKTVRASVGPLILSEHVEKPGVLTITGLLPSSVETVET